MMTINRQIEGRNFTFFCESWSNSRAWGHRAVLMQGGRELQDQKCRYYNRTWESWQYQSICEAVVYSEIQRLKDEALDRFRRQTGRQRIRKEEKAVIYANDEDIRVFEALYKSLN